LKPCSSETSARSSSHALLAEPTASTNPQQNRSGPRHRAVRAIAPLAVSACCAALLATIAVAPTATAGTRVNGKYVSFAYIAASRQGSAVYINGLVKQDYSTGVIPSHGRTIYLQRNLNGAWQTMLSRVTNWYGRFTVGFISVPNHQYRYVVIASGSAWGTTSGMASTAPAPISRPGPTNTGVPAGTALRQYYGNLVVTTAGATYDALDIHGFVTIKAANVTITRSIIRGGIATAGNPGLVTDTDAAGLNFALRDSELVPEHPSVYIDGIRGANYTVTRTNIHGTVDTAKVIGNNATIQNSWLHDTVHYLVDPAQGGGPSHNDGVQVLNGTKIRILNNTITGADNSGLQVTQGNGAVSDLWFNGNWADGGGCTANINNYPLASMDAVVVNDNRFGHATRVANCPIIATRATSLTAMRNVYDDTSTAVVIKWG